MPIAAYGPRYLLPMLPLLCLPLVYWFATATGWHRTVLGAVVVASVLGQVPGVLVDFTKVGTILQSRRIEVEERRWSWEFAGLPMNVRASIRAVPLNIRYVTGMAEPPAVRLPEGRAPEFSEQFGYSLDVWWLYLYYMRAVPAAAALGAGAALLGLSGLLLAFLFPTSRDS